MLDESKLIIDGTGYSIPNFFTESTSQELFDLLGITFEDYHYQDGFLYIFSEDIEGLYFLEEYYLKEESKFNNILNRFSSKRYTEDFNYYSPSKTTTIPITTVYNLKDINRFRKMVENNILVIDGLKQETMYVSPSVFDALLKLIKNHESIQYVKKYEEILLYMRELFSLIAISEKMIYENLKGKQSFSFQFFDDTQGVIDKKVDWGNWETLSSTNYYLLYEWLIENSEDTGDSEKDDRNLHLLKNIVQDYIRNVGSFEINEEIKNKLDSILSRIRNNQTKTYFEQQNKLKDEMIVLIKDEMESKKKVYNRLIGVLTTASIGYYSQFFNNKDDLVGLEDLKGENFPLALIFFFSSIAIIFFMISLLVEIIERKSYYEKVKKVYVDSLFFKESDFTTHVKKPSILKDYWFYWLLLILSLCISVKLMHYYF